MNKISDIVEQFFNTLNISDDKGYLPFLAAWEKIVGLDLASHCHPEDIKNGLLIVVSDHPGWIQRFKMNEKDFFRQISNRFPQLGIKKIVYRHGVLQRPTQKLGESATIPSGVREKRPNDGITIDGDIRNSTSIDENEGWKTKELPDELKSHLTQFKEILKNRDKQG